MLKELSIEDRLDLLEKAIYDTVLEDTYFEGDLVTSKQFGAISKIKVLQLQIDRLQEEVKKLNDK